MIKNFIIVDNIIKDPDLVRNSFLKEKYYCNEEFRLDGIDYYDESLEKPKGCWRGFRTEDLTLKYPDRARKLLNRIVSDAIGKRVETKGEMYGHISTTLMTGKIKKHEGWHQDTGNLLAGVVYLSEAPGYDSGTWIKINGKIRKIENRFNRLLMYRADLLHTPGNFFGDTACNSRLTLTFFINTLCIFNK
jgi:hypothetical protein